MTSALYDTLKPRPQSEPMAGREVEMVKNEGGGYVFPVDIWTQLERFLVLGTEGGTYYVDQRKQTTASVEVVRNALAQDGERVVEMIVSISESGRAPKNDQAIYALAMAASCPLANVRALALSHMTKVCRISTHLFMFIEFLRGMRGMGRAVKRALAGWYLTKMPGSVALQVTKYKGRTTGNRWTHRDVLRLAHPVAEGLPRLNDLFSWVTHPDEYQVSDLTIPALRDYLRANDPETSIADLVELARVSRWVTWEMIPSNRRSKKVWEALVDGDRSIPMGALIRQLPTLTRHELLTPMTERTAAVAARLTNPEALTGARVHPMQMLVAGLTYGCGKSVRGKATWSPTPEIREALSKGFSAAYGSLPETDKRIYVGLDVSASMGWPYLMGVPSFTPAVAGAAMTVTLSQMAGHSVVYGFAGEMRDLGITRSTALSDAVRRAQQMAFGQTDCALPMLHALDKQIPVDAFVVITDSETWAGRVHPAEALQLYRAKMGIPAKLVVLAMTSTAYSIADPADAGMMDVVGFDTRVPRLVEGFVS